MATCALFGCPNPPSKDNAHCIKHKSLHKPAVVLGGKAVIPKAKTPPKVSGYCVEYATKKGTAARMCQHVMCSKAINAPVLQLGKICEIDGEDETLWFHLACMFAHMETNRMIMPPIAMKKVIGVDSLMSTDRDALSALVKMEAAARKTLDEQRAKEAYLEKESEKKFWAISVSGTSTLTRWGPIGDVGFDTSKDLGSEAAAKAWMKKKIAEKEAGGYCRIMKLEEDDSDSEEEMVKPLKKSKLKQAKSESESEEEVKSTSIKKKSKATTESDEDSEEVPPPKKKSKASMAPKKKGRKVATDSDEDLPPQPPPQKSKKFEGKKKPPCPYGAECWYVKDVEHCRNLSH